MTPFIISTPLYKQLFGHFGYAIKTQANREILGRGGIFIMTRMIKRTLTLSNERLLWLLGLGPWET